MQKTTSLNQIFYEMGMDKIHRQELDRKDRERKSAEKAKKMAKISRIIVSLWELKEIIARLKDGHSVVIDSDGNIFTGRVKTENLHGESVKLPGKCDNMFDVGTHEFIATRSFTFAPGKGLAPAVRNTTKKAPIKFLHPVVSLFNRKLGKTDPKDISRETFVDSYGHHSVKISIRNYPVEVVMNLKTGKIYEYVYKGKITPV